MLARHVFVATLVGFGAMNLFAAADPEVAHEPLQKLNEFVGEWKGTGGPDKPRPGPDDPVWKESMSWSWRFKKDERWLSFQIQGGTHLKSGDVKYLADKKRYELTAVDAKDKKLVFTGQRDEKGYLTFEREDPNSREVQQLIMNSAGDGTRFVYRYAVKPTGRTVFTKVYQVAATKEGESLAAKPGATGTECIVTGGKGTIPVSYQGKTYYVCCTGCRDAFNENPEKYIREAKK